MNAIERIAAAQQGFLPGLFGFEWLTAKERLVEGRLQVERRHLAPTGYLHAATVVAFAELRRSLGSGEAFPASDLTDWLGEPCIGWYRKTDGSMTAFTTMRPNRDSYVCALVWLGSRHYSQPRAEMGREE